MLSGQPIPKSTYPRWAVVGRSNVGKSSLLNAMVHPQELFRTGQRAGVTIGAIGVRVKVHSHKNAILELVDLPGYGYAERSKHLTESWNQLASEFRDQTDARYLTWIWLVDSRRKPDETDMEVLNWVGRHSMILVFTKSDKIKTGDRPALEDNWKSVLIHSMEKPIWASAQNGEGLNHLQRFARASVKDYCDHA